MKKHLYVPLAIILLIAFAVSGCGAFQVVNGSGKVITENRQVEAFSGLTLEGIGNVYVTQSDTTSLRIEAEDNLIPYFETSVRGGTLTIGVKHEFTTVNLHPTKPIKFYVSTPDLNVLTLAGSGNIITEDLDTDIFTVSLLGSGNISTGSLKASSVVSTISGSGNITFGSVTVDKVTSTITGSGNISLKGETTEQNLNITGSGDYLADELKSENTTVNVTGSGKSQVWATGKLSVTITGSGDVSYHGSPQVNTAIIGSGHVKSTD